MSNKYFSATCAVAFMLTLQTANATVTPIVNDYGNVGPTILDSGLASFRTSDAAPWFVTFNLKERANVQIGAQGVSGNATSFTLTFVELDDNNGNPIKGPTAPFTNPFPESIDQLVIANNLPAGHYAIEINGSGNAVNCCNTDIPDFVTRLQVTAVPEPETYALILAGIALTGYATRKRMQKVS